MTRYRVELPEGVTTVELPMASGPVFKNHSYNVPEDIAGDWSAANQDTHGLSVEIAWQSGFLFNRDTMTLGAAVTIDEAGTRLVEISAISLPR